jgi:hypothetical protein
VLKRIQRLVVEPFEWLSHAPISLFALATIVVYSETRSARYAGTYSTLFQGLSGVPCSGKTSTQIHYSRLLVVLRWLVCVLVLTLMTVDPAIVVVLPVEDMTSVKGQMSSFEFA